MTIFEILERIEYNVRLIEHHDAPEGTIMRVRKELEEDITELEKIVHRKVNKVNQLLERMI